MPTGLGASAERGMFGNCGGMADSTEETGQLTARAGIRKNRTREDETRKFGINDHRDCAQESCERRRLDCKEPVHQPAAEHTQAAAKTARRSLIS